MGARNTKYDKDKLLENLISDVNGQLQLKHSYGKLHTNNPQDKDTINHVSVGPDFIQFDGYKGSDANITLRYTPSETLSNLNKLWGYRIFEGETGYFIFGDIINKGELKTSNLGTNDLYFVHLRLPFYKIPYTSYLDHLPQEIIFVLLSKLDQVGLESYLRLYKDLLSDKGLFRLLIRQKYPKVFEGIMTIYPDLTLEEITYFSWDKLYQDLVILENRGEIAFSTYDLLPTFSHGERDISDLFSHYMIKQKFPLMYQRILIDKFSPRINAWRLFYVELSDVDISSPIYTYITTGRFPPGQMIDMDEFYAAPVSGRQSLDLIMYLMLIDNDIGLPDDTNSGTKFRDWSNYLDIVEHVIRERFLIDPLFDHLGITKIKAIIEHLPTSRHGRQIGRYIVGYVLHKREKLSDSNYRTFLREFGVETLRNLTDSSFDIDDTDTRDDVEKIIDKYG